MEKVRRRCGFNCGIEVGATGSKGGLCLAWKEDINVELKSYSKKHIDVLIKENVGRVLKEEIRMEAFRKALDDCKLGDVGYLRIWFTWERGNLPETNIKETLDRGLLMRSG
ncbi:BEACH domain-containing lvsC [Gossypium australe]|uniref:BEACH domain-containing lvsC n=1 Tax=Gossypium australe TaxID=47621 RepID=A0A5B6WM74_9ROSI|nr:BEACH domain-containing lvsC [Gossypium australe]